MLINDLTHIAHEIIDLFECLLADNNIKIPDDFREGEEDEACLYGRIYYELEDAVVRILQDLVTEVQSDV